MELLTEYGIWKGARDVRYDSDGKLSQVFLVEPNAIKLPHGIATPLHSVQDSGRRRETPLLFHPNGKLKSLPLQDRVPIKTAMGTFPAELLTFHDSGELRKIFPSAGKLTGFWTEEHEYGEAPVCEFTVGDTQIFAKIISIQFYPSGAVQAVTLWPEERLQIQVPWGKATIRTGISFYEDGALQSFEPASPTPVPSEIGTLMAYDSHPIGVSADKNSLYFAPDGQILSLLTMTSKIQVRTEVGEILNYSPQTIASFCEEADTELRPLRISFTSTTVLFGSDPKDEFPLLTSEFSINNSAVVLGAACCQG